MARSVAVSRWLVASSKIRSSGLRKQRPGDRQPLPLAAGEVGPAFADDRLVALGQAGDELVEPGGAGRRDHLVQLGLGSPRAMFSRSVPLKMNGSCDTMPMRLRRLARSKSRRSTPSMSTCPSVGS